MNKQTLIRALKADVISEEVKRDTIAYIAEQMFFVAAGLADDEYDAPTLIGALSIINRKPSPEYKVFYPINENCGSGGGR